MPSIVSQCNLTSQNHIDKAVDYFSNVNINQGCVDKIVEWQEKPDRWCFHTWKHIVGHRNIYTSSYSESNHASLVSRIPDNQNRTVEELVTYLQERESDILQEQQKRYFKWEATKTMVVKNYK